MKSKLDNKPNPNANLTGPTLLRLLKSWDAALYLLISTICFFSFNHGDILHTIGCSSALLNGHFTDFYEINTKVFGSLNYLPSTYIIFAIWGLPLRILGYLNEVAMPPAGLIFWYKILTSIFFAGCGVLVYKIAKQIGYDAQRARYAIILFISSPIAIFSQFIFGQYDIITVFFMLLGLYFYFKNDLLKFTLWMSVAMTFKYFPIFIFLPMLALKEKRLSQLAKYALLVLVPVLLEISLYIWSPDFRSGVLHFPAANRVFSMAVVNVGAWPFNIIFYIWPLIIIYAYLKDESESLASNFWGLRLALFAMALIFSTVLWHPQWMVILTPILALLIAASIRIDFFILLDSVFSFLFFSFTFRSFEMNVDTLLMKFGVWGPLNPNIGVENKTHLLSGVGLYRFGDSAVLLGVFNAILLAYCLFLQNKDLSNGPVESKNFTSASIVNLFRVRFFGVLGIFLISAVYAYWRSLNK